MLDDTGDFISLWKRIGLFCRKPLLFGGVLCLAQVLGYPTSKDAALLGAEKAVWWEPGHLIVSILIILSASVLPGVAILLRGVERGLALGIVGLLTYYLLAWGYLHTFHNVLPVLLPTAAWYVSQVIGIGWRPHQQNLKHILPQHRRTTFISYRRQFDEVTARMLKHELTARGFDVFLDVDDLGPSARFDRRLLEEIDRRTNFVLILSPGSLDRCEDENDWLTLEITHALATGRKIVPFTRGGFELTTDLKLPAAIVPIPLHNAVAYSSTYHKAAIEMLISFLSVSPENSQAGEGVGASVGDLTSP